MISDIAVYMPLSVTLTVLSDVTMGTSWLGPDISEKSFASYFKKGSGWGGAK
jgi:hypothetical protein